MSLNIQEAVELIEQGMRGALVPRQPYEMGYTSYGYDVYLPSLIANNFRFEHHTHEHTQAVGRLMDAAWWYVGRGLLRPGVKAAGGQDTSEGASQGFSITRLGKEWLARERPPELPISSPSRMNTLLDAYRSLFGEGFARRATEAVNCYDVRQYLACCVMAGAAAEGIVLNAAIAKYGNEEETLRIYAGRDGRRSIENKLVGQIKEHVKQEFRSYMDLLKYWRDHSAHGAITDIAEQEAYLALVNLARFARFMADHWSEMTTQ